MNTDLNYHYIMSGNKTHFRYIPFKKIMYSFKTIGICFPFEFIPNVRQQNVQQNLLDLTEIDRLCNQQK